MERLLVDWCGDFPTIELVEGVGGGSVRFRGRFSEADVVNKNKRSYPYEVLNKNVQSLMEMVKKRRLLGELDHPTDSIVHLANASHVVTKLWWEDNVLMGEGEVLGTPNGEVLRALISSGIPIGISSRGVGNGKVNESGIFVISDGFKLITFDAVADPSCAAAFQEKITNKRESFEEVPVKNEGKCIDRVSKDALFACFESIVKEQANQIRARI